MDGAWISEPRLPNLVDRSPCANRVRRAIITQPEGAEEFGSRDRRKAAGLIAR